MSEKMIEIKTNDYSGEFPEVTEKEMKMAQFFVIDLLNRSDIFISENQEELMAKVLLQMKHHNSYQVFS